MAGGIDWFRWHHGTVNDQKFPLVARKACASVAEVIAVWACLLERASQATARGSLGDPDFEAMDCALGIADGKASAIFAALQSRALIDVEHHLTAWATRQPKKEDEGAAGRKRAQREREAAEKSESERDAKQCHDASRDVTTEKKREEKNSSSLRSEEPPRKRREPPPPAPSDVDSQVWNDWLQLRKDKSASVTPTVIDSARKEAAKASMTFEEFLREWCARGSQGLKAEWLDQNKQRAGPQRTPTAAEQRAMQAVPSIAAPHLRPQAAQLPFVEEVSDESSVALG